MRRLFTSSMAALLGLIGLAVPATQLASQSETHAAPRAALISCTGGTITGKLKPEVTITPTNITGEGKAEFSSCDDLLGSGFTNVSVTAEGASALAICVPIDELIQVPAPIIGPSAFGWLKAKWVGGGGGTTIFNWTITGAISVGPNVSVLAISGNSVSGPLHGGTPAAFTATIQLTSFGQTCANGIKDFAAQVNEFIVVDVI